MQIWQQRFGQAIYLGVLHVGQRPSDFLNLTTESQTNSCKYFDLFILIQEYASVLVPSECSFVVSSKFSTKIVLCLAQFIFPSALTSFLVTAQEKHHQSIMLSPPYSTEGMGCSGFYSLATCSIFDIQNIKFWSHLIRCLHFIQSFHGFP